MQIGKVLKKVFASTPSWEMMWDGFVIVGFFTFYIFLMLFLLPGDKSTLIVMVTVHIKDELKIFHEE